MRPEGLPASDQLLNPLYVLGAAVETAFDNGQPTIAFYCDVNLPTKGWLVRIDDSVVPRDFGLESFDEFVDTVYPLLEKFGGLGSGRSGVA